MKTIILFMMFLSASFTHAQVGIGTATPSSNSVLDVNSANKGLMLPRLNDTTSVSSPSAGLLIYNLNTKSPAFHNGTSWNSLAAPAAVTGTDSVTYTITNAASGFINGTYKLENVSHGLSNTGGNSLFDGISFTKLLDINSTGFAKNVATGPIGGSMVIEIKFYIRGSLTPYYSLKASSAVRAISYSVISGNSGSFVEAILIAAVVYGYKDWINNISFGWNTGTSSPVAY